MVAGNRGTAPSELVRNMENSRHFRQAFIVGEINAASSIPGDNVQVNISSLYVPETATLTTEHPIMPDLRTTRRKLTIAFVALAVLDVAAAAVLLSPIAGSQPARRQELDGLWKELQQKTRQSSPCAEWTRKSSLAQQQINTFYKDRLPDRDSAIFDALGRVAAQSGVKIDDRRNPHMKDPEPVGLTPVEVEAQLSGNYLQLMRFVNTLERDQLFFIVSSVQLGGQQGGMVKLQIKLETYLKTWA